jgi:threonine synthase
MSFVTELVCDQCHGAYSDREPVLLCPRCGGVLDPRYDLESLRRNVALDRILARKPGVWRWREFLPIADEQHFVDIGAAGSPLIECPQLSRWIGARIFVKYEGQQPTGSLKDRSFAVAVAKAAELKVRGAITYSSGNAAASLAAHANHVGMPGLIVVNSWADRAKLAAIHALGMQVVLLDWSDFREVEALMAHAIRNLGLFAFVNFQNPWRHDGYKTYAYENWLDLGRRVPDHQIHPIGTGGGIFGSCKGYRDLVQVGWTDRLPRLHGTQPAACQSVVTAFHSGAADAVAEGDPRQTIAEAVANNVPLDAGRRPLRAIRETNGQAVAITDDEMRDGIRRLGQEGIFAEPAGASTVWAAKHLAEAGVIGGGETVVLIVTATGLKQAEALPVGELPRMGATAAELERVVRAWMK